MSASRVLFAIAIPCFFLALCFAYRRKGQEVDLFGPRLRMVETRQATAPRLAGALLVVALLTGGIGFALYLLGGAQ